MLSSSGSKENKKFAVKVQNVAEFSQEPEHGSWLKYKALTRPPNQS